MFAPTSIKGIERRLANIVCKKADVDMNKRAGELTAQELEHLMVIIVNPRQFKTPYWFLNRKKDYKDGKYSQVVSNALDMKLRDDLERLKKIRNHCGLRHYCPARQHDKSELLQEFHHNILRDILGSIWPEYENFTFTEEGIADSTSSIPMERNMPGRRTIQSIELQ